MSRETIWDEAFSLPEEERRTLAFMLLESLGVPPDDAPCSPAIIAELRRREEEYLKNPEDTIPAEQVFAELDAEFGAGDE